MASISCVRWTAAVTIVSLLCALLPLVAAGRLHGAVGGVVGTQSCNFTQDMDYSPTVGGSFHASSSAECCQLCWNTTQCLVGVYQAKGSTCYWKGGHITPQPKPGSGLVACVARPPAPPAPPYDCSSPTANCALRLGATHWNPCYFLNSSLPSLLDGAVALAATGMRVIKVAVFNPEAMYPFNSPAWPASGFDTLLETAQHQYYRALWAMPEFDTFILIAYSTVGGKGGGDISYWTKGITPEQEAEETRQLRAAAAWLHSTYPEKNFVIENWEGDWASRAGSYDPNKPATPLALASMIKWLRARQQGVTLAREDVKQQQRRYRHGKNEEEEEGGGGGGGERAGGELGVEVGGGGGGGGGGGRVGKIYFSAEVNLVQASRTKGDKNMVNAVLPYVATDMVSYSSYDTESDPENFRAALVYLQQQHNRTAAAPLGPAAVFVAEYGMGENTATAERIAFTVRNVVNEALAFGASFVVYWETFCNECTGGPGCSAGRCHDPKVPVADPKRLHGFWLLRPDGSRAWPYTYLSGMAQGSKMT